MTGAWDVISELRLEDGRRWPDAAESWQLGDMRAALAGPRPYGYATRPRGGSKTGDAAAAGLAWALTAPRGARGYLAAADQDQAALLLDALRGYLDRSPHLRSRVELQAHRLIVTDSGASLEALASDAASSWGLRPELLIADELGWWGDTPAPRQFWESLSSAIAKSDTARLLVLTSPSSPSHWAHKVLEHARGSELWWTSEQSGLVPWLDPRRVEEQRRRLSEAQFRRLFLGEWAEGEEQLAAVADVDGCVTHSGPLEPEPRARYVIGADLGVRRDRTAVAVCHRQRDRVVVDRIALWRGSRLKPVRLGDVEDFIRQASRSYNRAPVVADPWQAIQLLERLRGEGIRAEEFTFSQAGVGRLAAVMVELLRDRRLALPEDDELLAELRAVRLVERAPGSFRIDHAPGQHDDQVIAIALAAQHLLRERRPGPPAISPVNPWKHAGRKRKSPSPKVWVSGRGTAANPPPRTTRAPGTPAQVRARTLSRKRNQSRGGRT